MFSQLEPLNESDQRLLQRLREFLKSLKKVCVAYSGGVDSTLIATIAHEQLQTKALAITGVSAALSPHLRVEARKQAEWIGIRHQECLTNELQDPGYINNPENRCYACKKELHQQIKAIAITAKGYQIIDGVNHDDLNDHRPGIEAAKQAGVRSPLAELQISKTSVRAISRALGLPWWDKPAQPCLASRFPYGEIITAKRLQQVEKAEQWLRDNGFPITRVRTQGLAARIELPKDRIQELIIDIEQEEIVHYFLSLGFTSVSIDLEGLVSGKLNRKVV